ncbi:MAG: metallophosphoesterase family protein [Actinomycetes bacterium]
MRRRTSRLGPAALLFVSLAAAACSSGERVAAGPPVEVWAVGDGPNAKADDEAVAAMVAEAEPDRVLFLGDVYGDDYAQRFDETFGSVGLVDITLPTPGNHEWPSQREAYLRYWSEATGAPTRTYYATRIGGWQVISLNSEEPIGRGSAQHEWLRNTLDKGAGTCRLAFLHRPRWSAGRHGDQRDLDAVWDALTGRASLVLSGHDHSMQRLRSIDGITQLVVGSGGRNFYPLDFTDPRLRFGNNTEYGALQMRLTPGRADLEFVSVSGDVLDTGRVPCRPA